MELAVRVRFGCTPVIDGAGRGHMIAWVIAGDGKLLWLAVVPVED